MSQQLELQIKAFYDTIKTFQDAGALEHVIVVGSWAEFVYQESKSLSFRTNLKTHDMDILIPNINKPRERIDLVAALEKKGFELRQSPEGLMKFDKDGQIDLEFLAREIGSGQMEPYKVNSMGVTAQGLRNMDILTENIMSAKTRGFEILVPRPEAYILHKLVINEDRKPEYKKEKDINAVKNVLEAIQKNSAGYYLQQTYDRLTKKQQARVQATCKKYEIELPLKREVNQEKNASRVTSEIKIQEAPAVKDLPKLPHIKVLFAAYAKEALVETGHNWSEITNKTIAENMLKDGIPSLRVKAALANSPVKIDDMHTFIKNIENKPDVMIDQVNSRLLEKGNKQDLSPENQFSMAKDIKSLAKYPSSQELFEAYAKECLKESGQGWSEKTNTNIAEKMLKNRVPVKNVKAAMTHSPDKINNMDAFVKELANKSELKSTLNLAGRSR